MNGIDLTQIQREAVDYVLPFVAKRWAVDGEGITTMRHEWLDGDEPLPTSWTFPEVWGGELVLSDFQEVNDSLYNYVLAYAKMRGATEGITDYQKRKIRKECKDLATKIVFAQIP